VAIQESVQELHEHEELAFYARVRFATKCTARQ
jgi:hypothetical protein